MRELLERPYRIIYRVSATGIEILTVKHYRQRLIDLPEDFRCYFTRREAAAYLSCSLRFLVARAERQASRGDQRKPLGANVANTATISLRSVN